MKLPVFSSKDYDILKNGSRLAKKVELEALRSHFAVKPHSKAKDVVEIRGITFPKQAANLGKLGIKSLLNK